MRERPRRKRVEPKYEKKVKKKQTKPSTKNCTGCDKEFTPVPRQRQRCDDCRNQDPKSRKKIKVKKKDQSIPKKFDPSDYHNEDGELDLEKVKKAPYSQELTDYMTQYKKVLDSQYKKIDLDVKRQSGYVLSGRFVDSMEVTLFFSRTIGEAVNWVKGLPLMAPTMAKEFEGIGAEKAKKLLTWIAATGMERFEEIQNGFDEELDNLQSLSMEKAARGKGGAEKRKQTKRMRSA